MQFQEFLYYVLNSLDTAKKIYNIPCRVFLDKHELYIYPLYSHSSFPTGAFRIIINQNGAMFQSKEYISHNALGPKEHYRTFPDKSLYFKYDVKSKDDLLLKIIHYIIETYKTDDASN